jgi:hypothetical protein
MPYKRCVVKTTVIKVQEREGYRWILALPIVPSAVTVVRLGEDITYWLKDHENQEVLALIGYETPMPQVLKDFNKQFGIKWSDIKNDPDYALHWPYTKETAWGTWDRSVYPWVFTPYDGPGKDDLVKFKHWEE